MEERSEPVSLRRVLDSIDEAWTPRVVAELNDHHLRAVKLSGEFVWHAHAEEDELFLVLSGRLRLRLRDRVVELAPGELFVVPRGVEHRPEADEPVECLVLSPARTRRTGDVDPAGAPGRDPLRD